MDPLSDLYLSHSSPDIYKVSLEATSVNELVTVFNEEILADCSHSSYETCLIDYITTLVEPVGWRAVWRSSKESTILDLEYDFIVEVTNVCLDKLEAEVQVKSIIETDDRPLALLKKRLNDENFINVPLIELYVVSEGDDEEFFAKTAIAIEHVRLFLTHIIRPWDGEEDTVYSEEILKSRIQLYFDMQNNALPKTMISKIKSILKEGTRVQKELQTLFSDMNVSDSEAEINEEDLIKSMSLKKRMVKLQAKMEMLENPVIRSFVTKKYSPSQALRRRPKPHPITYIVSKVFTSEMISKLSIDSTSILEFEHNPEAAFKCSSSGDKIYIFPGVYQCDTLGWLEGDVCVEGVGHNGDIVLEATGNSEVLLNCCAQLVQLQNITLKAKAGLLSAIVVHHGKIELRDCIINSNEAEIGILLLGGSEALVENCEICNSCEDGIQMRSLSGLHLNASKIILCEKNGIQIDAETSASPESFTEVNILESHITNNGGHGIFLSNVAITDISLQRPSGEFNVLKLLPWLKYQVEDSIIDRNDKNGIGISSSCISTTAHSFTKPFLNVTKDDLSFSALSDLLNEVNVSTDNHNSHEISF